jgi:hypothetical protein
MIASQTKGNNYFVSFVVAPIMGALIYDIYLDISNNGLFFSLPILLFSSLAIILFLFENDNFFNENSNDNFSKLVNSRSSMFRKILTFNNVSIFWVLSLVGFFEAILIVTIFGYALNILSKFSNHETTFLFFGSSWFIGGVIFLWMTLLYFRVFSIKNQKIKWIKILILIIFFLSLVVFGIGSVYYPKYVFELFLSSYEDNILKSSFYLKPHSIWDSSVWLKSAGKTFLVFLLFNLLKTQLRIDSNFSENQESTSKLQSASFILFIVQITFALAGCYASHLIYINWDTLSSYNEAYQRLDYILISLILFVSFVILTFNFSNRMFKAYAENSARTMSEIKGLPKLISSDLRLFILLILIGGFFGSLFYFVEYNSFFLWIGSVFLLALIARYALLIKLYYTIDWKSKLIKRKENTELSSTKSILLKWVFPIVFIPSLIGLMPSIFNDFIFNKSLNERIEYLQDAGRISSYHHEREPLMFRDHYSIITAIDSNQLHLNEIDSLNYLQKDSIRFYLENRLLKKNETFRFNELQLNHAIVTVKNVSRISLLIFISFIIYSYLYQRKTPQD